VEKRLSVGFYIYLAWIPIYGSCRHWRQWKGW